MINSIRKGNFMTEEKRSGAFRTSIGGQALIEGILMRGPEKQAIVVRDREGNLVEKVEELKLIRDRYPILGVPLIRGTVNFLLHKGQLLLRNAGAKVPHPDHLPRPLPGH